MAWILIACGWCNSTASLSWNAEFNSQGACVVAGEEIKRTWESAKYICVRKG